MKKLFLSIALLSVTGIQAGIWGDIKHGVTHPGQTVMGAIQNPKGTINFAAQFSLNVKAGVISAQIITDAMSGKLNQHNYKQYFANLVRKNAQLSPEQRAALHLSMIKAIDAKQKLSQALDQVAIPNL